jgi:hypothetical protein
MKTRSFTLLLYSILVIRFASSELDLPRGSECLTSESVSGVCRNYNECEVIITGLKNKEITQANVTFCNEKYLVVCCPLPVLLNIQSERISERSTKSLNFKKCNEN